MSTAAAAALRLGWSQADLTPPEPVSLIGQLHARVSEGVRDPVTATALALEGAAADGSPTRLVLVSCDLVGIPDSLRDGIRRRVAARLPELPAMAIVFNATHTHTGPDVRLDRDAGAIIPLNPPVALPVMPAQTTHELLADRVAEAVVQAWQSRAPAGLAWGLGHAVIGRNRRWCRADGSAIMYGNTNDPTFRHIEGYEDHSVNLLATYAPGGQLTGLVINLACPSQVSEHEYRVSADFWHDVRVELRRRYGPQLAILPQCSAAGDQSPHHIWAKPAEQRMLRLLGREPREEIALRIADAVGHVLPAIEREIAWTLPLAHQAEVVPLPRRMLTEAEVAAAQADAAKLRADQATVIASLDADRTQLQQPRWYIKVTGCMLRAQWLEGVAKRFALQQREPTYPVEVHTVRLGEVAIATNPFEYYMDFGMHIKARSPAQQTFVVQLAGSGTYVPSARAMKANGYGAVPASTIVGAEGGQQLAEHTVQRLQQLWPTA
jgi:hypothetical protein